MNKQTLISKNPALGTDTLVRAFAGLQMRFQEWRSRQALRRDLADATDHLLRDAGLIRNDVEAAFTDDLDQPAWRALKSAQMRTGNW